MVAVSGEAAPALQRMRLTIEFAGEELLPRQGPVVCRCCSSGRVLGSPRTCCRSELSKNDSSSSSVGAQLRWNGFQRGWARLFRSSCRMWMSSGGA